MVQPTRESERIAALDIARGIALFGILIVNLRGFSSPDLYLQRLPDSTEGSWLDGVADTMVDALFQGKFYTLFSFLFGAGFAIFLKRAEERGGAHRLMVRRLGVLFAVGLAHVCLLWWGDILLPYAVCGFALLAFNRARPQALLAWAIGLLAFATICVTALQGLVGLAERYDPDGVKLAIEESIAANEREVEASAERYGSDGTWSSAFGQRMTDWGLMLRNAPVAVFPIMAMFLLGAYAFRSGFLDRMVRDKTWRIKAIWCLGTLAAASTTVKLWAGGHSNPFDPGWADSLHYAASNVADPAGSLFYFACICGLVAGRFGSKMTVLQDAGRMALTLYLAQSLIATTLFYGYGGGLYGRTGDAANLAIAIAVYGLQLAASFWWMRRYRYGPMEWLWRAATYGHFAIPFRKMR